MILNSTVIALKGGSDDETGRGQDTLFTFGGTWALGETFTITLTDELSGLQTQYGAGNVTGIQPTFAMTLKDKVYLLAGTSLYFPAIGDPTVWNDPNGTGNDFITMSNNFGFSEDLTALAVYQGQLLVTSRRAVQIWRVDPDPSNNAQIQVLPGVGTMAKLSVQAVGDMDVYLLHDSGVRSIRVRDASNNAGVIDIGSPVDALVRAVLAGLSESEKAAACAIVEPSADRYWLYLPGHNGAVGSIYVLSAYVSAGIAAWSTYEPAQYTEDATIPPASSVYQVGFSNYTASYSGLVIGQTYTWTKGVNETSLSCGTTILTDSGTFVATATTATGLGPDSDLTGPFLVTSTLVGRYRQTFIPEKFAAYNGQVYVRAGDDVYLYGGANDATYDGCGITGRIPFIDCDSPKTRKHFTGLDASFEGTWTIGFSASFQAEIFKTIYQHTIASFDLKSIPIGAYGTHFALEFSETGTGYARLASALVDYNECNVKR